MGQIWRPQRDGAVLVPEVDNGIVRVLRHDVACAELCAVLDDQLASGGILIF